MDINNIYSTFHPTTEEYTFFSSIHGAFSRIDHVSQKTSINKCKMSEIISSLFSKDNSMKLEVNYKKKTGKFTNVWRLNNMPLNH